MFLNHRIELGQNKRAMGIQINTKTGTPAPSRVPNENSDSLTKKNQTPQIEVTDEIDRGQNVSPTMPAKEADPAG
jgi:hypothetical protein